MPFKNTDNPKTGVIAAMKKVCGKAGSFNESAQSHGRIYASGEDENDSLFSCIHFSIAMEDQTIFCWIKSEWAGCALVRCVGDPKIGRSSSESMLVTATLWCEGR